MPSLQRNRKDCLSRLERSRLKLQLSGATGCHGHTLGISSFVVFAPAETVLAKDKGPEVNSLRAFMRVSASGLLCCGDD